MLNTFPVPYSKHCFFAILLCRPLQTNQICTYIWFHNKANTLCQFCNKIFGSLWKDRYGQIFTKPEIYHTLITVYRIRQFREPEYLGNILGKTSRLGQNYIIVDNIKLGLVRNSFTYRGALQWNRLPPALRVEPKIGTFKKNLKKWILENITRFLGWNSSSLLRFPLFHIQGVFPSSTFIIH